MKMIALNLPDPLYQKVIYEVETAGFAGKSDFFRFLAMNYFLTQQGKNSVNIDDDILQTYESDIVQGLAMYLKKPKNISRVIHVG